MGAFSSAANSSSDVTSKLGWLSLGGQLPGKPANLPFGLPRGNQGTSWDEGLKREGSAVLKCLPIDLPTSTTKCLIIKKYNLGLRM